MTSDEATLKVIDALNALSVPYMLVGSWSVNFYCAPRSSQDADFVVQMDSGLLPALMQALGSDFRLDPQPRFESVTTTLRFLLQVPSIKFDIELFRLSDDPHDQMRFSRRTTITSQGRAISLPTVEDVVITKLRWAVHAQRLKDQDDVRNVIALHAARIDWNYVLPWCEQHGTRELLDQIRQSLPSP